MHSPMKNQQATSTPTTTFMAVWRTVHSRKVWRWRFATLVEISAMAAGISAGVGGTSSTFAYLRKVFSFGVASSLAAASRTGAFFTRAAILNSLVEVNQAIK